MRITIWILSLVLVATLTVAAGQAPAPQDEDLLGPLKRFSQVLDLVEDHYVRPVGRDELINGAIEGMLQRLDPHSTFMSKDDFREMQISTQGEFGGIGIEITLQNGRLTVISPIEDTPAYKAGMKAGDIILEIDGHPTQDITLVEAVKMIRGPKGTKVELTILHKGGSAPEKVSLVRDTIPIRSAKSETLEDGYLYLRLTRFNENTTEEMRKLLKKAGGKAAIKGLVLDLRNNPGGLLDQAVSVADAFLPAGNVVYIQGRDASSRKDFNAKTSADDIDAPMVVLINAGSASASEIVAGALQDRDRALLLGEKTFGKATVQTVIPLADESGIKLTTALYYTPRGRSIQAQGIEPDMAIPFEAPHDDNGPRLGVVREEDLSGHIENQNGKTPADGKEKNGEAADLLKRDNQLRMALQLVKQLPRLKQIK
ncbi:MAG: S41 family peptidase [Thermodesulfobacteriota bacterium]